MDADGAADEQHRRRTAKSCGPDASTLASSLRRQTAGDGDKQARSPRRSRRKPLKPLRAGMPGQSGEPTVTMLVCSLQLSHARLRVHRAPGIPHALLWAENACTTRAHPRREKADSHAPFMQKAKPIPSRHSGAMRSIEPGIHNPRPWLWIPGLRPRAHPGMTLGGIFLPLPHPSLRAQRSNPSPLRMCHGLLRFARNDDQCASVAVV
jgi:hypothetical protein